MSEQRNLAPLMNDDTGGSSTFSYERWREAFLRVVMRGASVVGVLLVLVSVFQTTPKFILAAYISIFSLLIIVTFTNAPYTIRAIVFSGLIYSVGLVIVLGWGIFADGSMYLLGFIGISALLFDHRVGLIANIITFLTIVVTGWVTTNGIFTLLVYEFPHGTMLNWLTYAIDVSAVGVVLILASYYLKREFNLVIGQARQSLAALTSERTNLENRVQARTADLLLASQKVSEQAARLGTVSEVARTAISIQTLESLLNPLTHLISQRFGYYHVGIFLLDPNKEFALLSAANSSGGQNMLSRGHRLRVGQQGIVGYVTSQGVARIALDVGEEAVFFNNPDLPETRSEVALPLKFGNEIIGALDIQSTEPNAFSQEDVDLFSILADQVSVAIQNARSLEQAQRALREAEIASSQLTGQAWKAYSETIRARGYRYDGIKPEPMKRPYTSVDDKDAFSVPVQLRGQTIGRLKLKLSDPSRKWTEDELAIIDSTAERVALAMDGARLLDEAQKRATRETFLSELAAKLGTSFQMDSILRDTVEELGQVLKGSTITFQLVNPSLPPTAENEDDDPAHGKKAE